METVFQVCAALGGIILICQLVASLIGMGGDHDVSHDAAHDTHADHDHGGNWFVGLLTVKTVTAAVAFFGLGGLTAIYYGAPEPAALGVAVGSAVAALYLVAILMKSLHQLRAEGTVKMDRALGQTGTVYLRIPAGKAGPGKVHLNVQNRTVEYQAVTAGAELPTGAPVRVVAIVSTDTVEVEAA